MEKYIGVETKYDAHILGNDYIKVYDNRDIIVNEVLVNCDDLEEYNFARFDNYKIYKDSSSVETFVREVINMDSYTDNEIETLIDLIPVLAFKDIEGNEFYYSYVKI